MFTEFRFDGYYSIILFMDFVVSGVRWQMTSPWKLFSFELHIEGNVFIFRHNCTHGNGKWWKNDKWLIKYPSCFVSVLFDELNLNHDVHFSRKMMKIIWPQCAYIILYASSNVQEINWSINSSDPCFLQKKCYERWFIRVKVG